MIFLQCHISCCDSFSNSEVNSLYNCFVWCGRNTSINGFLLNISLRMRCLIMPRMKNLELKIYNNVSKRVNELFNEASGKLFPNPPLRFSSNASLVFFFTSINSNQTDLRCVGSQRIHYRIFVRKILEGVLESSQFSEILCLFWRFCLLLFSLYLSISIFD